MPDFSRALILLYSSIYLIPFMILLVTQIRKSIRKTTKIVLKPKIEEKSVNVIYKSLGSNVGSRQNGSCQACDPLGSHIETRRRLHPIKFVYSPQTKDGN